MVQGTDLATCRETPAALVQVDGGWYELQRPADQFLARDVRDVPRVLRDAEAAAEAGRHIAGFVAYEAGSAFGLAAYPPGGLPLASFVAFEHAEPFDPTKLVDASADAGDLDWQPGMTADEHAVALTRIREHLAAGDTYQVNLTFPLTARFTGDPFALFARLARSQRSSCAAYIDAGRFVVCSASPETFFERDGDQVTMRPMKGTSRRGRTLEEDAARAEELRQSEKERAENLMIVDMVRNDLGRIARTGTVRVPSLFDVETFPTILQMTSTVEAETDATLAELFAATFPCASVTGAPKMRTAELIRELEPSPRGVYTGAVGYLGPGRIARFNVAIRTATIDRKREEAVYGIGSGIVWDSRPEREYEECLAKARVLSADPEPFSLLETIRWDPGDGFTLLGRHLNRMESSARFFGHPWNRDAVESALEAAVHGDEPLRVRLLLHEDGRPTVETFPLPEPAGRPVRIGFATAPIDPGDPFLWHKTDRRRVYDEAKASRPDCDEVVLWTQRGLVTETNISNLAIRRSDGAWVTPPVEDGLLAGTYRAELLSDGCLVEGSIVWDELADATAVAVFNSLRGWRAAEFVPRSS